MAETISRWLLFEPNEDGSIKKFIKLFQKRADARAEKQEGQRVRNVDITQEKNKIIITLGDKH